MQDVKELVRNCEVCQRNKDESVVCPNHMAKTQSWWSSIDTLSIPISSPLPTPILPLNSPSCFSITYANYLAFPAQLCQIEILSSWAISSGNYLKDYKCNWSQARLITHKRMANRRDSIDAWKPISVAWPNTNHQSGANAYLKQNFGTTPIFNQPSAWLLLRPCTAMIHPYPVLS